MTPGQYADSISRGGWGGGIEMAVVSSLKKVNIHVYEKQFSIRGGYKRISAFDHPENPEEKPVIRVLYGGRNHYGEFHSWCYVRR